MVVRGKRHHLLIQAEKRGDKQAARCLVGLNRLVGLNCWPYRLYVQSMTNLLRDSQSLVRLHNNRLSLSFVGFWQAGDYICEVAGCTMVLAADWLIICESGAF